jgi:signal transduction histidine kinase
MSQRPGTVFWKVAPGLAAALVATALLAVGLSAALFRNASGDLIRDGLTLRLDRLAEEFEGRATWLAGADPLDAGRFDIPRRLRLDLATRLPDPLYLVDPSGRVEASFGAADSASFRLPSGAAAAIARGEVDVDASGAMTWAVAPLLAPDGLVAGALVALPLDRTLEAATAAPRAALRRAIGIVALAAAGLALALAALMTSALVRPLRRITRRVESLGAGEYSGRLPAGSNDELGRLAAAVNEMAARVEEGMAALRSTDRLRRDLVASVGHDLRTPLASLTGYLEEADRLLDAGRAGDAAGALATARHEARRTTQLVSDLFELAVLDAAPDEPGVPGPLRLEPVPLAELLAEATAAHRSAFDSAGVSLETNAPASLPVIRADGPRLLRMLDNLLANARRHTPAGGSVRMTAEVTGDSVVVRVADSGPGVPEDEREAIFERYYRGGDARTRGEGTGLGLAIARAVARAHGGDLTVELTPGGGATLVAILREPLGGST